MIFVLRNRNFPQKAVKIRYVRLQFRTTGKLLKLVRYSNTELNPASRLNPYSTASRAVRDWTAFHVDGAQAGASSGTRKRGSEPRAPSVCSSSNSKKWIGARVASFVEKATATSWSAWGHGWSSKDNLVLFSTEHSCSSIGRHVSKVDAPTF